MERFLNAFARAKPTTQSAEFAALIADGMTDALKNPDAPIRLGQQVPDLETLGQTDPSKLGYYYVEDQEQKGNHLLLIRVYEQNNFSKNSLGNAIDGIRRTIAQAAGPFKQFKVALTGRPALEADEMTTTDRDARRSEIAALSAVFIGLVLLLRSLWIAIVAEIALLVGIGWTFGWATLTVHRLNLLSMVFIIALTGIGMDYLIQVLTRYRRESARRSSPRGIWTGVFKYVAAPINTACLGAAGRVFCFGTDQLPRGSRAWHRRQRRIAFVSAHPATSSSPRCSHCSPQNPAHPMPSDHLIARIIWLITHPNRVALA